MLLVADHDHQENMPKPSENSHFHCFPVNKRFMSLYGRVLAKSTAEAPGVGWKSTPVLMVPVVDDLREIMPKLLESWDFHSFPVQHKIFVSLSNMTVRENSLGDADAPKPG